MFQRASLLCFPAVLLMACSAASDPDAASSEADVNSSPAAASLSKACLAELDRAEEIAGRAEPNPAGRGFIDVFTVACSVPDYSGSDAPTCIRTNDGRIDMNYAPPVLIERHETYRDVIVGAYGLSLESATTLVRPSFSVEGTPDALHVRMTPAASASLPRDLASVAGSSRVEFAGRIDGDQLTAVANGAYVMWNVASCARALLRATLPAPTSATDFATE